MFRYKSYVAVFCAFCGTKCFYNSDFSLVSEQVKVKLVREIESYASSNRDGSKAIFQASEKDDYAQSTTSSVSDGSKATFRASQQADMERIGQKGKKRGSGYSVDVSESAMGAGARGSEVEKKSKETRRVDEQSSIASGATSRVSGSKASDQGGSKSALKSSAGKRGSGHSVDVSESVMGGRSGARSQQDVMSKANSTGAGATESAQTRASSDVKKAKDKKRGSGVSIEIHESVVGGRPARSSSTRAGATESAQTRASSDAEKAEDKKRGSGYSVDVSESAMGGRSGARSQQDVMSKANSTGAGATESAQTRASSDVKKAKDKKRGSGHSVDVSESAMGAGARGSEVEKKSKETRRVDEQSSIASGATSRVSGSKASDQGGSKSALKSSAGKRGSGHSVDVSESVMGGRSGARSQQDVMSKANSTGAGATESAQTRASSDVKKAKDKKRGSGHSVDVSESVVGGRPARSSSTRAGATESAQTRASSDAEKAEDKKRGSGYSVDVSESAMGGRSGARSQQDVMSKASSTRAGATESAVDTKRATSPGGKKRAKYRYTTTTTTLTAERQRQEERRHREELKRRQSGGVTTSISADLMPSKSGVSQKASNKGGASNSVSVDMSAASSAKAGTRTSNDKGGASNSVLINMSADKSGATSPKASDDDFEKRKKKKKEAMKEADQQSVGSGATGRISDSVSMNVQASKSGPHGPKPTYEDYEKKKKKEF